MNILSVNTSDIGGGAESSAVNLSAAFRDRGHRSVLLVGRKAGPDGHIFEIPPLAAGIVGRTLRKTSPVMARFLDRLRSIPNRVERLLGMEEFHRPGSRQILAIAPFTPDVLVFHNLHGRYFDLRALERLSRQVPCVLILRDSWLLSGHCAHPKGCTRWRTGCGSCPDLSIYPAVRRDATSFNWKRKKRVFDRSVLYVAAPSQWQIDRVHESMLHGRGYRVIPNAIDMDTFRPGDRGGARERLGLSGESPVIVFTAHSEFKDLDTMLGAALTTLQHARGRKPLFICLGKTGAVHRAGDGRIIFPGFISDQGRLADYYRAADICLHAAHDETFGKSITEAMACGIPVIATETGGIPEQITHGVNGYLVAPGDAQAMSDQILRLLEDPEQRTRVGSVAHESAGRYTLASQASRFIEWFTEVTEDWASFRAPGPEPSRSWRTEEPTWTVRR